MNNIKLLDCTLRDGGYINDWEFGHFNLVRIFERLVSSGVEVIELGFLDDRRNFDVNRSIFPTTNDVAKIYGSVDKKNAITLGMIDYGTCAIENLQPASESYLDGIRVIFKKHLRKEAMAYCKEVKDLGYKVFTQAVSITSYDDEELLDLIRLVNEVKPYALSMVDTYGLLYKENMMHIFEVINSNLDESIGIGYHAHNNFQLGFSNVMEVLRQKVTRQIIVDGTLYGMGKSAGNAPLELIAMNLNEMYGKDYDISQILEAIDCNIMKIYEKHYWGYNLFYFLASSNHCHPNYVKDLMEKHTLSIKSVNEILERIEEEKKLMYDGKYLEDLYFEYQKNECNDSISLQQLKKELENKNVLILGPGKTISTDKEKISNYIKNNTPIVISINFIPENLDVDYLFVTNPRRYNRIMKGILKDKAKNIKLIATSNVTPTEGSFDYTLNNEALLNKNEAILDNSYIMLLKVLMKVEVKSIICAGLDGYSKITDNYADTDMEYWFTRRDADSLNDSVKLFINEISNTINIEFLTDSFYHKKDNATNVIARSTYYL
ncbi:MAG: aldolase catalytic domain-containing protein [Erysipelotrichaceae bacterium]